MVKLTSAQIHDLMVKNKNVRNLALTGDSGTGKTKLTESLVNSCGIQTDGGIDAIADPGGRKSSLHLLRMELTTTQMEQLDSADVENEGNEFLVSLIDTPGLTDFSVEFTSAMRVVDGTIVVIDSFQGVCLQTEQSIISSTAEKVKPVFFLNSMDKTLNMDSEKVYQNLKKIVGNVTDKMAEIQEPDSSIAPSEFNPSRDIGFGSGEQGWGFTLLQVAGIYASKFQTQPGKLARRLWGENYFSGSEKKWNTTGGPRYVRGFNLFCLDPLKKLFQAITDNSAIDAIEELLRPFGVQLGSNEKSLTGTELVKATLSKCYPLQNCIAELACIRLPSPAVAQKYRVDVLYDGPSDDSCAFGIRDCDPNSGLTFFVSKMVPTSDRNAFYGFGRVFSGKVKSGVGVKIMEPEFKYGSKWGFAEGSIDSVKLLSGQIISPIDEIPCGNICLVSGFEEHLTTSGTLSTSEDPHSFTKIKHASTPMFRASLNAGAEENNSKLFESMKKLAEIDKSVQINTSENGIPLLAACSENHIDKCIEELQKDFGTTEVSKLQIDPVLMETVTDNFDGLATAVCESYDKRCKVVFIAEPHVNEDMNYLDVELDINDVAGLDDSEKRLVEAGFKEAVYKGVLAGEKCHGIKWRMVEFSINGANDDDVIATVSRAVKLAQFKATPRFLQPIVKVEIEIPNDCVGVVFCNIPKRNALPVGDRVLDLDPETAIVSLCIPGPDLIGFVEELTALTGKEIRAQMLLSHWECLASDPTDPGTRAHGFLTKIRRVKGMCEQIPKEENFM